jgi:hypothetical protein
LPPSTGFPVEAGGGKVFVGVVVDVVGGWVDVDGGTLVVAGLVGVVAGTTDVVGVVGTMVVDGATEVVGFEVVGRAVVA